MKLSLPKQLHYPITITKVTAHPGAEIAPSDCLFSYSFLGTTKVGGVDTGYTEKSITITSNYESPTSGILKSLRLSVGQIISQHANTPIGEIEEQCTHPVQYEGLCAICGRDMTELTYNMSVRDQERAKIAMAHESLSVKVSAEEAQRSAEQSMVHLLKARKLVLVVDLDLTVIHAAIDPTIGEWMADEANPNWEVLQGVRTFQLVDDGPFRHECTYYIKLRPGLEEFLRKMSGAFEMHIYTMGTRSYAEAVARIIDPERTLFGDRILSRSESGSLTAKNLKRLFPVDDRMVLVIDDRADVWNWIPNLLKVYPYDFFVGIGDINSSFLPKKVDTAKIPNPVQVELTAEEKEMDGTEAIGEAGDPTIPDDESRPIEAIAVENDPASAAPITDNETLVRTQEAEQDTVMQTQIDERPLSKLQSKIDAEDDEAAKKPNGTQASASDADSIALEGSRKTRHSLLTDDDDELSHLERHLLSVHSSFYRSYDRTRPPPPPPTPLKTARKLESLLRSPPPITPSATETPDLSLVPDVKAILPSLKLPVLRNTHLVFSGVIPLGVNPLTSDIGLWSRSFGATVSRYLSEETTHLVAARAETQKVNQALRMGVKIVTMKWIVTCLVQWRRVGEEGYLLLPNGKEGRDLWSASEGHSDDSERTKWRKGSISHRNAAVRRAEPLDEAPEELRGAEEQGDEEAAKVPLDISDDDWDAMRAEFDEDDFSGTSEGDEDEERDVTADLVEQSGGRWKGVLPLKRSRSESTDGDVTPGGTRIPILGAKRQAVVHERQNEAGDEMEGTSAGAAGSATAGIASSKSEMTRGGDEEDDDDDDDFLEQMRADLLRRD